MCMNVRRYMLVVFLLFSLLGNSFSIALADAEESAIASSEPAAATEANNTVIPSDRKIFINLAARSLAVYDGNEKLRLYPIGPGKPSTPTPIGYYKVEVKELNPSWINPSDTSQVIGGGTESNPLGYRWIQFNGNNYGIHGTNKPESIGHFVSNGCIRMNEAHVEALFDLIEVGTPIEITYNRVVVEKIDNNMIVYYIYPDGYSRQNLTVADINNWLSGYGVDVFESDEAIQTKIEQSDGNPTYIAQVYPLKLNGQKLARNAVMKDSVAYLPVDVIAENLETTIEWDEKNNILSTAYGKATGYDKKGVLYCNSDDVSTLFNIDGGLDKENIYQLNTIQEKKKMPEQTPEQVIITNSEKNPETIHERSVSSRIGFNKGHL